MRPQDTAVLLKTIAAGKGNWQNKDYSAALALSGSEISESLNRGQFAGLTDGKKIKLSRQSLMQFLEYVQRINAVWNGPGPLKDKVVFVGGATTSPLSGGKFTRIFS